MESGNCPSAVLQAEHVTILRVIEILRNLLTRSEQGNGFERRAFERCVEFFRFFADACHHAKEEDLLFPVLESRGIPRDGGPIGVMLHEHSLARQYTKDMSDALDAIEDGEQVVQSKFHSAAHQYIELLTDHICKEDNVLFKIGDRVMSDDDKTTLCNRFCEVGCRDFGGKKREELEQIADELEQQWSA